MNNQLLVNSHKHCIVEASSGNNRLRLAISLAGELTNNKVASFSDDAVVSVQGADELASTYQPSNWIVGVMSGALFAFRALLIVRQRVVLTELSGHLRSSDMDALASCVALAIARLAGKELSGLELESWTVSTQVIDRTPATQSQDGAGASSRVESLPSPPPMSAASA